MITSILACTIYLSQTSISEARFIIKHGTQHVSKPNLLKYVLAIVCIATTLGARYKKDDIYAPVDKSAGYNDRTPQSCTSRQMLVRMIGSHSHAPLDTVMDGLYEDSQSHT